MCYITQEKTQPIKQRLSAAQTTVSLSLYITCQIIPDASATAMNVPIVLFTTLGVSMKENTLTSQYC